MLTFVNNLTMKLILFIFCALWFGAAHGQIKGVVLGEDANGKKEPIYGDFRPGDVRHSQASIDKAKELLEYEPQFRIAEGLNEAIGWYINSLK